MVAGFCSTTIVVLHKECKLQTHTFLFPCKEIKFDNVNGPQAMRSRNLRSNCLRIDEVYVGLMRQDGALTKKKRQSPEFTKTKL